MKKKMTYSLLAKLSFHSQAWPRRTCFCRKNGSSRSEAM